jgi:hypothetical protein
LSKQELKVLVKAGPKEFSPDKTINQLDNVDSQVLDSNHPVNDRSGLVTT